MAGTVVLDLSLQLPGPYATLLLSEMGARVIKVEPPTGDVSRVLDPAMFQTLNAGKESIILDLQTRDGQGLLRRLAATSDVFVEGFRPGTMDRLGGGYAEISALRPAIVYCSISGFGADGPYRSVPGHDLNYLGVAGGVGASEDDPASHRPHGIGIPMVDLASGTMAVCSILISLFDAVRTGRGRLLDVAMLDSAVFWSSIKRIALVSGEALAEDGSEDEPAYMPVQTADGLLLSVAVLEDKFWRNMCGALGWEDWLADPSLSRHSERRRRAAEIRERLELTIATRRRSEWLDVLWAADVPVAPIREPAEVPGDPQVRTRGLFERDPTTGGVRLRPPLPQTLRGSRPAPGAPAAGAHTDSILAELGLAAGERRRLVSSGACREGLPSG